MTGLRAWTALCIYLNLESVYVTCAGSEFHVMCVPLIPTKEVVMNALHTFITDSCISCTCPLLIIVIRCQHSCLYFDFNQDMSFVFNRTKLYFRGWVKSCLYHFTDKVGIRLWILQDYNHSVILYSIE